MESGFCGITCPTCFECFELQSPPASELPAEVDYDCEVCCSPMVILFQEEEGRFFAESRGLDD